MFSFLISLAVAMAVWVGLHGFTRRFVRGRLRYVDAVQKAIAPWLAGGATLLIAAPLAALLPIVGVGTALTAALAVGTGVAGGARDIRRGLAPVVHGS